MITENKVFLEDLDNIVGCKFIQWEQLKNKTFFITGGTGLIGTTLVDSLIRVNEENKLGIKIIVLARDLDKAKKRFFESDCLKIVVGDVQRIPEINEKIDYVIHSASQTSSKGFVENPVETINIVIDGTRSVLALAREKKVESFIFLSTMEVYGYPEKGHKVKEEEIGSFDVTNPRNCYPISKIMAENICFSYFKEYGVPIRILRLTQTFGPGVEYNDGRVFAEFARCAIEKKDIILRTKGETERSYLYTADAVTAIITAMLKGQAGDIYNVANEETYCSIIEMAKLVSDDNGIRIKEELENVEEMGYAKTLYMDLSTEKIRMLGWKSSICLIDMYRRLLLSMRVYVSDKCG